MKNRQKKRTSLNNATKWLLYSPFQSKLFLKMNNNGLFCFLMLLAFYTTQAAILEEQVTLKQEALKARSMSMEAEKATLTRAIMETTLDAIIEENLKQGVFLELEPDAIKANVNMALEKAFEKMRKPYSLKFEKEPTAETLNRNSIVLVKRIGKKTVEAEYQYTGGLMKQNEVKAVISEGKVRQEFKIPIGYTIKTRVVE